jgi:hypothetical protein
MIAEYHPKLIAQFTLGNPITLAEIATYDIDAFQLAPIRVLLYDDGNNGTIIQYDTPSSTLAPALSKKSCPKDLERQLQQLDDIFYRLAHKVAYGKDYGPPILKGHS